jgi:hypothetical protein
MLTKEEILFLLGLLDVDLRLDRETQVILESLKTKLCVMLRNEMGGE